MLCRVLFIAAVVSYVLCVLLLSGVQKEDLDAATLRKLQRHNVNIDAIADRKLREQCLTEKDLATTLSTLRVNLEDETIQSTMKPISIELDTQIGASPAQWKKLLTYIKQQKDQNAVLKKTTMQSIITHSDDSIDLMPSHMRSRFSDDTVDPVTKIPQNIVKNNDSQKSSVFLKNCDKAQHESSTANDKTIADRSNDVEYISKIVAEILSQRQPNQVKASTVLPMRTFNTNKLVKDIDKILEENKRNDDHFRTDYSFNNTSVTEKRDNYPEEQKGNEEDKEIIKAFLDQLRNRDKLPITNERNSFRNNGETNLKEERKLALYNGGDKIPDISSFIKNKHNVADQYKNNWLYVIDRQSIKPFSSEPSDDLKMALFNQLNERDKAFLCKTNNKNYFNQIEKYTYKCPNVFHSESSKVIELTPEEQKPLFNRPNQWDKTSYSESINENYHNPNEVNKGTRPYFSENKSNAKGTRLEMEHNSLDIKRPSDLYEPMKEEYPSSDNGYKSKWPFLSERPRHTEQQKIEREQPNLLLNRLSDGVKATEVVSKVDKHEIKTYETPLFPLGVQSNPKGGNYYKTEWVLNEQGAKELEPKLENRQENQIFNRPNARERMINPNYPSFYGELKNTRPYYYEDIKIKQEPNLVNKKALYEIPTDREMSLNNQKQMLIEKESSVFNRLDDRQKTSELLTRDRSDPKSEKWFEVKIPPNMKDNQSTGTLEYKLKVEPKSFREQMMNTNNNIDSNFYKKNKQSYLTDGQINQYDLITTDKNKKDPTYFNDSRSSKHNTYEYEPIQKDTAYNNLLINTEARSNLYQQYNTKDKSKSETKKEDDGKIKSLSPDVLKVIADTVKEIVLKDLKKDTSVTSTTTTTKTTTTGTPTTTTKITSTTELTTTTTTSTSTTPMTTKTIIEPKTEADAQSTTEKENHIKIQEASKALESFMELFAKFNFMKNGIVPNVTQAQQNITRTKDNIKQTTSAVVTGTMPTMTRNAYAPYNIYSSLLPSINPYSRIRSPYLQTKNTLMDPYVQKIQIPNKNQNNALNHAQVNPVDRSVPALTFQTNSNEIAPLKISVSKGTLVDNIVLSPKPPRDRRPHLREYSDETFRYRTPNRYQTQKNEFYTRSNRSKDPSNSKFGDRPTKPRSNKKEYTYNNRFYNSRPNLEGVKFHEKLEKEDNWARQSSEEKKCGSKEGCNDRIAQRVQRPLVSIASTYDDTHFRNFLKTQQKVNDMLERILATKTKHNLSGEVI